MAKRPSTNTVSTGYNSATQLNESLDNIVEAFDNTLSRDGSTPNNMGADLDMDGNNIVNVSDITVDGTSIADLIEDIEDVVPNAEAAAASAAEAETSANKAEAAAETAEGLANGGIIEAILRDNAYTKTESSLYRCRDFWQSFLSRKESGQLTATYPATIEPTTVDRIVESTRFLANRDIVIQRLRQLAEMDWTPVTDLPGEQGDNYFTSGVTYEGAPYSSVKTLGRTVGQDVSIETFVTAAQNPDSILYEDFTALPNYPDVGSGVLYYGAVCSNFIARGFGWVYSPVTRKIDSEWLRWGFYSKTFNGSFNADDLHIGDILCTDGGGHIEIVYDKTATTLTLFDQGHDGPELNTYAIDGTDTDLATTYLRGRNYNLFLFDYTFDETDITYEAEPFAPIDSETLTGVVNPTVKLNKGNKANYNPDEDVRFNIVDATATNLIIQRSGVTVEIVPLTAPEIITRTFTTAGNYSAYCNTSGGNSAAEEFKVSSISATISDTVIDEGETITVSFTTSNCEANTLIVETADTLSFSNGIMRPLTSGEINSGTVDFSADLSAGDWHVRLRASNDYGGLFNEPIDGLTFTVS